tara:strand:- start:140 stop:445 length:306 start_codon:yes stop_codon:yes gene_type:complete
LAPISNKLKKKKKMKNQNQIDKIINLAANNELLCSPKIGDTRIRVDIIDWNDDNGTVTVQPCGRHKSIVPWEVSADSFRIWKQEKFQRYTFGNSKISPFAY